jgi:hypothetical protein
MNMIASRIALSKVLKVMIMKTLSKASQTQHEDLIHASYSRNIGGCPVAARPRESHRTISRSALEESSSKVRGDSHAQLHEYGRINSTKAPLPPVRPAQTIAPSCKSLTVLT